MQPIIRRLHTQSQHVFLETNSGVPPRIHNDIFRPSNQEDDRITALTIDKRGVL